MIGPISQIHNPREFTKYRSVCGRGEGAGGVPTLRAQKKYPVSTIPLTFRTTPASTLVPGYLGAPPANKTHKL